VSALGKALLIGAVQVALVLAVGGKFLYDRATLPRAWVQTAGFDPLLPIRGRYVSLGLLFDAAPESASIPAAEEFAGGTIVVRGEAAQVILRPNEPGDESRQPLQFARRDTPDGPRWMLVQPVAFFLPEHAPDPTRDAQPGDLWMEVTVPPLSVPRPIRLRRSGGE
jgi:hypothetical protein